jgi:hypothetical protein
MPERRFPRWLAAAVLAEALLACVSLALVLAQIADLVRGDEIFRFNPLGATAEVIVNAGIPALVLVALTLVRPLRRAWWHLGSGLTRSRGVGALVVSSWLLLNMAAGALVGPSSHVSSLATVSEALGAAAGIVVVVGIVWLGRSQLQVQSSLGT